MTQTPQPLATSIVGPSSTHDPALAGDRGSSKTRAVEFGRPSGRITQLDGIRAFAVMAVFLNHTFDARLLWMGVDLFFILSGFLITGILIESKHRPLKAYFGHFYQRRAKRILPPYILLLAVTSVLFGLQWIRHWYLYLGLMNLFIAFPIAHPRTLDILWSLAVEEQFYLVWPFVIFFLSESALLWTAAAIVALAPALRWFCTPLFPEHWAIYSLTPFRMDLLAVGALMALAWRRHRPLIEKYGSLGILVAISAVLGLLALSHFDGLSTHANTPLGNFSIYELSLAACTGTILWALSGKCVWIFNFSPIRYIGRISYTIYLIHETALAVVSRSIQTRISAAIAALAITIAYASLSWYLVERPLLTTTHPPGASEPTGLG